MDSPSAVINKIIRQEKQLIERKEPIEVLSALIDDEFMEMGRTNQFRDKQEVMRWLLSEGDAESVGMQFKATPIAQDVLLITYITSIKKTPESPASLTFRASVWRKKQDDWQIIYHQATPINR